MGIFTIILIFIISILIVYVWEYIKKSKNQDSSENIKKSIKPNKKIKPKTKKNDLEGLGVLGGIDEMVKSSKKREKFLKEHKIVGYEYNRLIGKNQPVYEKIKTTKVFEVNTKSKVLIKTIGKETTLGSFIKDWDLDIKEVKKELKENSHFENDWLIIEIKRNKISVEILTTYWENIDNINRIYGNEFYLIVKDHWNSVENNELKYITFVIEKPESKITDLYFKVIEDSKKHILTKDEENTFLEERDRNQIETTDVKYQEVFITQNNTLQKGWEKTLKNFNLDDINDYHF